MHIHPNQFNPQAQLDAVASAQKAAANAAAARTRKRLTESASELAGEAASEAFVVEVESYEQKDDRQRRKSSAKHDETGDPTENSHSVSDWA